ncbi:MAG: biotin/lipoyl-binding protein, partial [Nitrospira sp.]|nr:biotin/lipoyl-binding protein [Nitrospira sp.]
RVVVAALMILLMAGLLPLDRTVSIPAVLEAQDRASLFAPAPSKIRTVLIQEGVKVDAGQPLFVLESPDLDRRLETIQERIAGLEVRLQREASYQEDRDDHQVVWETLRGEENELEGVKALREQLVIRSPFSGIVTDLNSSLYPGRWLNTKEALAHVTGQTGEVIHAFATEEQHARLVLGNEGWFYPDDWMRPARRGWIRDLRQVDEAQVVVPYVASIYSGSIPVRQDGQGVLHAEHSVYRVELNVEDDLLRWDQVIRGVIRVEGRGESVLGRLWTRALSILIREGGL